MEFTREEMVIVKAMLDGKGVDADIAEIVRVLAKVDEAASLDTLTTQQ